MNCANLTFSGFTQADKILKMPSFILFQAAFMTQLSALAILGPTASGKTALALHLANEFPCEIISLDSALVYRDMNIGTAKPSPDERSAVPHHLIDIISPLNAYSAADFVRDCVQLVADIRARQRVPLIVGGTMMYFHALTQGLNDLPDADEAVRALLQTQKQQWGLSFLYQRLQQCDPETAARLKENDAQRIERALEVFELTGKPLSQHLRSPQNTSPLKIHSIALIPEQRALLHTQINQRFQLMLQQGFLDEVVELQKKYPELNADMPSMRCVGYRQAWAYLADETDKASFIAQAQAATRQLAKRQLTWLRKLGANHTLDPFSNHNIFQAALTVLRDIEAA